MSFFFFAIKQLSFVSGFRRKLLFFQVAVPLLMASILTYPECVNHHNIEKLRQCVRNGPKKYPGAKFVIEPNGDKK